MRFEHDIMPCGCVVTHTFCDTPGCWYGEYINQETQLNCEEHKREYGN